jgi:hypothetical protein
MNISFRLRLLQLFSLLLMAFLGNACQNKQAQVSHSESDEYYFDSPSDAKISDDEGSPESAKNNQRPQVIQIPAKPPTSQ